MNASLAVVFNSLLDGYSEPMPLSLRLPDAVISAGTDAGEACFWAIRLADSEVLDDWTWHIELNASGELELTMFPGPPYDLYDDELTIALYKWNREGKPTGLLTGPKRTAYRLANGAVRRPVVSWTSHENLVIPALPFFAAYRNCPDFVVELRSDIHMVPFLLAKMQEYMDNGAKLGWFIDPLERTVRIYRAGAAEPELLTDPETLDGEDVLPGFVFEVRKLIFDLV